MATPVIFPDGITVRGASAHVGTFSAPSGSITAAMIAAAAGIEASKVVHQNQPGIGSGCIELFGPTTSVAAVTKTIGMAYASGTILAVSAWQEVDTTGADRTITVDLHKSTGAGAYATVLSATIGFVDGSAIRTAINGTLSTATYVAGDIFRWVVTVAGAAGAAATGLTVRLVAYESPA